MTTIFRIVRIGVLVAPLALGLALSCNDDGDDKSNAGLCGNYCDQIVDCYGQVAFDDLYSSQADCSDECADGIDDVVEDLNSQCESLYRNYLACLYGLDCNDLEDEYQEAGDECSQEWGNLVDECGATASNCNEENVQTCADIYTFCAESLDPGSSSFLDDLQDCLDTYCDCLDSLGCDMSEVGCD